MKFRSVPSRAARRAWHAVALTALVGFAPLWSATEASALTADEIRCRDLVATSARYAAGVVMKARGECVRGRLGGEVSLLTDCLGDPVSLGGVGTGDPRIDKKIERVVGTAERRGARLEKACASTNPAKDVVPTDVLDPGSACGAEPDWPSVGECTVALGKAAADSIYELFDVMPFFAPLPEGDVECVGSAVRQARETMFTLGLWRAKCFRTDDTLTDGGGTYECDANISPPGAYNTTGWLLADKRLEVPMETLGVVLYGECDKDLVEIGFDAVIPDHSGGDFDTRITLDDVYDSLNDRIHGEVTGLMAELFPVGGYCGDGNVDAGEDCDDGNNISNDGCDRDCSNPTCGNGAIDGASSLEECDDGNLADGDGCSSICEVERCGNAILNLGWDEQCDHGGESPTCDLDCTFQSCGDGYLNVSAGEQCDLGFGSNDSNAPDTCGDGSGPSLRGACILPYCQDAVIDTGEICDDGAETVPCDTNCTPASCGDGDLNATRGETCDDGNAVNTDSCPSSNPAGSPFCITATCGDGFFCSDVNTCSTGPLGGPEECDGAGVTATCDGNCSTALCGDGTLNALNVTPPATAAGEQCDDGDLQSGDGCDVNCTTTRCGNGVVTAGEVCDDGNDTNGDGCDDGALDLCRVTACGNGIVTAGTGETCDGNGAGTGGETASCDVDCTARVCGDGVTNVTGGEDCDDAGFSASCDNNCTFAFCGDGTVNAAAGEACDDGNLQNGDGCESDCQP